MMKRFATTMALLAVCAAPAFATTLVSESFSYLNGALVPNGGWAVYSGLPPTDIQIIGGRAVGSHANAPDDHLLFPAQLATSTTYACFDVVITPSATGGAPKAVYFIELKDAGATNLVSRVYVLPIAGGFTFGISHSSTSALVGVTPFSNTPLVYGQKYNIVINYNPVAHTSSLWVDPASELSANVTDTNAAILSLAVSGVGLRQSASASTLPAVPSYAGTDNITYSVDNLGVGTTFADACVQYQTTPATKSTWGQVKSIYR